MLPIVYHGTYRFIVNDIDELHIPPLPAPPQYKHPFVGTKKNQPFAFRTVLIDLFQCRVSRSYLILFLLAKSYFVLFLGKCPILSYLLAILPLILAFYSLLITIISHENILLNILALLHSASKYFLSMC